MNKYLIYPVGGFLGDYIYADILKYEEGVLIFSLHSKEVIAVYPAKGYVVKKQ